MTGCNKPDKPNTEISRREFSKMLASFAALGSGAEGLASLGLDTQQSTEEVLKWITSNKASIIRSLFNPSQRHVALASLETSFKLGTNETHTHILDILRKGKIISGEATTINWESLQGKEVFQGIAEDNRPALKFIKKMRAEKRREVEQSEVIRKGDEVYSSSMHQSFDIYKNDAT